MIIWLNGAHGVGKTTAAVLAQQRIPGSRVLDAEKVGETLMDIRPGLPETDDFQHWPPWRPLVVETARRVLEYAGGTLIMPMTVLVEAYWREIHDGLAAYGVPVRHVLLHADRDVLQRRIDGDTELGPSAFRISRLDAYADAYAGWLGGEAEIVDTTALTPGETACRIAGVATG